RPRRACTSAWRDRSWGLLGDGFRRERLSCRLQPRDAPCGGGMRVVERRMQRVGRQRGGVILVELDERADELVGARVARGVRVGLELALSRVEAGERM